MERAGRSRRARIRSWLMAMVTLGLFGLGGRIAWSLNPPPPPSFPDRVYYVGLASTLSSLLGPTSLPERRRLVVDLGHDFSRFRAGELHHRQLDRLIDELEAHYAKNGSYPNNFTVEGLESMDYTSTGDDFRLSCRLPDGRSARYSSRLGLELGESPARELTYGEVVEVNDSRRPWSSRRLEVKGGKSVWSGLPGQSTLAAQEPYLVFPVTALPSSWRGRLAGHYTHFEITGSRQRFLVKGYHRESHQLPTGECPSAPSGAPNTVALHPLLSQEWKLPAQTFESPWIMPEGTDWSEALVSLKPSDADPSDSFPWTGELPAGPRLASGQVTFSQDCYRGVAGRGQDHDWLMVEVKPRSRPRVAVGRSRFVETYRPAVEVAARLSAEETPSPDGLAPSKSF